MIDQDDEGAFVEGAFVEDEYVQSLTNDRGKNVTFWVVVALAAFLTVVLSVKLPG